MRKMNMKMDLPTYQNDSVIHEVLRTWSDSDDVYRDWLDWQIQNIKCSLDNNPLTKVSFYH